MVLLQQDELPALAILGPSVSATHLYLALCGRNLLRNPVGHAASTWKNCLVPLGRDKRTLPDQCAKCSTRRTELPTRMQLAAVGTGPPNLEPLGT